MKTIGKIDQKMWRTLKVNAQNEMSKLELDITFYNIFNKINNRARNEPHRYLVCFVNSIEKRKHAMQEAVDLGYSCSVGQVYSDPNNIEVEEAYSFKIDLQKSNPQKEVKVIPITKAEDINKKRLINHIIEHTKSF